MNCPKCDSQVRLKMTGAVCDNYPCTWFTKESIEDEDRLEEFREKSLLSIAKALEGKRNSYDMGNQEKAYWTADDCRTMVKMATIESHIELAMSIFYRYSHQL
jgi:hypothetical protein